MEKAGCCNGTAALEWVYRGCDIFGKLLEFLVSATGYYLKFVENALVVFPIREKGQFVFFSFQFSRSCSFSMHFKIIL